MLGCWCPGHFRVKGYVFYVVVAFWLVYNRFFKVSGACTSKVRDKVEPTLTILVYAK